MPRTKAAAQDNENGAESPKIATPTKKAVPHYVDAVMKMHPDLETLYVSKYGGAFKADTPEIIRGNAILYNNPYFTK